MTTHKISKMLVMVAALVLFSLNAWASAIFVDEITHTVLGNPGEPNLTPWLNTAIDNYVGPPSLPGGPVYESSRTNYEIEDLGTIHIDSTGYVVLHWGGTGGGIYQAYYVNGSADFDQPSGYGALSFVAEYKQVPIPGAGLLLGSGIVGLVGVRRKMKK